MDRFNFAFFKSFREVIKGDIKVMFDEYFVNDFFVNEKLSKK